VGGLIRWGVDRWIARKHAGKQLTEEQLVAEGDKSPGVLMASGYIAGGAIAGILIAISMVLPQLAGFRASVDRFAEGNPLLREGVGDFWSLLPFLVLIVLLYLTGREKILAHRESA
jgi:hypothetical protein